VKKKKEILIARSRRGMRSLNDRWNGARMRERRTMGLYLLVATAFK